MKKINIIIFSFIIVLVTGCARQSVKNTYESEAASIAEKKTMPASLDDVEMKINDYQEINANIKVYERDDILEYGDTFSIKVEKVLIGDNISDLYKIEENKERADAFWESIREHNNYEISVDENGDFKERFGLEAECVFVKLNIHYLGSVDKFLALNAIKMVNMKSEGDKWSIMNYLGYIQSSLLVNRERTDNYRDCHTFKPNETFETVMVFPVEKETIKKMNYHIIHSTTGGDAKCTVNSVELERNSPLEDVYLYPNIKGNNPVRNGDCFVKLNIIDGKVVE